MTYYIIRPGDELYHHGIKGQKWDQKNGPPYPLDAEDHSASEKKAGWRDSLKAALTRKSKLRQRYEARLSKKYQEKYKISKEEADKHAEKTAGNLKKVAIGAGVAIGAAAAVYAASKLGREYCDDVIKAGTDIKTVSYDKDRMFKGEAFFTAHRNSDAKVYAGGFGQDIFGNKKFQIKARANKDIKVAGVKNGEQVYENLKKNNKTFANLVANNPDWQNYKGFNTYALLGATNRPEQAAAQKTFYGELKKRGYGAVADVNDRKYNNFKTHADIVFDRSGFADSSGNMTIKYKQLTDRDILQGMLHFHLREMGKAITHPATVAIGAAYAGVISAAKNEQRVGREVAKAKRKQGKKGEEG